MSRVLCRLDEIVDGQGKGFDLPAAGGGEVEVFVVRKGDTVYGYYNDCPHIGTPLNWQDDQFMTMDGGQILCATHGAVFRIEDGHCTAGPCVGSRLRIFGVECRDGLVVLAPHLEPA